MPQLERISFSLERPLLRKLQGLVLDGRYANRSEFLRDLIRSKLVEEQWERDREALGTITMIYDHHRRQLSERLTALQHQHQGAILATTHVHLDQRLCAEMIMLRGRAGLLREIADSLRRQKGVLHAQLAMSSTGRQLP